MWGKELQREYDKWFGYFYQLGCGDADSSVICAVFCFWLGGGEQKMKDIQQWEGAVTTQQLYVECKNNSRHPTLGRRCNSVGLSFCK